MPVIRRHLSVSQFCELVGIDEQRFHSVEWGWWGARPDGTHGYTREIVIVMEPEDRHGDDTRRDAADVRKYAVQGDGHPEGEGTDAESGRAEDGDAGTHAEGGGTESATRT